MVFWWLKNRKLSFLSTNFMDYQIEKVYELLIFDRERPVLGVEWEIILNRILENF